MWRLWFRVELLFIIIREYLFIFKNFTDKISIMTPLARVSQLLWLIFACHSPTTFSHPPQILNNSCTYSLPRDFKDSSLTLSGLLPLDLTTALSGVGFLRRSGLWRFLMDGVLMGDIRTLLGDTFGLARLPLPLILEGLVPRDPGEVLWRSSGFVTILAASDAFVKVLWRNFHFF